MALQYFTPEFFSALAERLNKDKEFQEKAKDLTTSVVQVAKDKAKAFLIKIEAGKVSVEAVDPAAQGEFRLVADYAEWARTVKGGTSAEKLILKGAMRLEGNMGKILKYRDQLLFLEKAGRELTPAV